MNPETAAWLKSGRATNWNLIPYYERAIQWVKDHTIGTGGVAFSDTLEVIHTGVSGAFAPVLEVCGEPELAKQYAKCAKDMEGDLFTMPGPADYEEAVKWARYEDQLYLRALALKYLLDACGGLHDLGKEASVPPGQINKLLMKDLEPMDKTGSLLDPTLKRIVPAALCIYAELCYRLGHYRRGDRLLQTVCALQRNSGGWFGSSHGMKQFDYYNDEEVCWVNLHFLEAVHEYDWALREILPAAEIDREIINRVKRALPELNKDSEALIIGQSVCLDEFSNAEAPGPELPLNLNSKSNTFDVVLAVNSMAFSLRPQKMIKEMFRVCKPGGFVIIVDKNITRAQYFKLLPNEQWFDANEINAEMIKYGDTQHLYFKAYGIQEMFIIWRSMKRPKEKKK